MILIVFIMPDQFQQLQHGNRGIRQIKLLHSGGNGVIVAAPDSNPASDRTLKLPSDGDVLSH